MIAKHVYWVPLLVLGIVAGGCNGDEPANAADDARRQSPVADVDVCGLLTGDQVARLLGEPVSGETDSPLPDMKSCRWQRVEQGRVREVVVEIMDAGASGTAQTEMATFRELREVRQPLDGVADEAFVAGYGVGGVSIVARSGSRIVDFSSSDAAHADVLRDMIGPILAELDK